MTKDCSLNFKFSTWKFQAQTWAWGEHVEYRNCSWHSEQFLYTTCSPHVMQKEELLTKIYLYCECSLCIFLSTKMMSNFPPFFSCISFYFFAFFAVALRNFTIHLKTQLILKEATPNCIWLDYYYLFSGLSAYYLEFLCILQSCIFVKICPVTN